MTREPTEMETRIMDLIANGKQGYREYSLSAKGDAERYELWLTRRIIAEFRLPNERMTRAMGSALFKSGLKRTTHVTTDLKHRLRWIAAVDAASPP